MTDRQTNRQTRMHYPETPLLGARVNITKPPLRLKPTEWPTLQQPGQLRVSVRNVRALAVNKRRDYVAESGEGQVDLCRLLQSLPLVDNADTMDNKASRTIVARFNIV